MEGEGVSEFLINRLLLSSLLNWTIFLSPRAEKECESPLKQTPLVRLIVIK